MARLIFVNLPVDDLERSKRFYEAIGARNEPKFSNEAAAMMVVGVQPMRRQNDLRLSKIFRPTKAKQTTTAQLSLFPPSSDEC